MKLLLVQEKMPITSSENKIMSLPLPGVGYGDSGCGSLKYLISSSGVFQFNNAKTSYNRTCEWNINPPEGQKFLLTVYGIFIGNCHTNCNSMGCDTLTITDGNQTRATLCGSHPTQRIFSQSSSLKLILKVSSKKTKFLFAYQNSKGAFEIITKLREKKTYSNKGNIKLDVANPTFLLNALMVENEHSYKVFVWKIRAKDSRRIRLEVKTRSLQDACYYGYLRVFDGPSRMFQNLNHVSNSGNSVEEYKSSGPHMYIMIHLRVMKLCNNYTSNVSFEANFRTIPYSKKAPHFYHLNITQDQPITYVKIIPSANGTGFIQQYIITADIGKHIELNFAKYKFQGPNVNNCEYEGIIIYDITKSSTSQYGPFCGQYNHVQFFSKGKSFPFISESNVLKILFYFYNESNRDPTSLHIKFSSTDCVGISNWNKLSSYPVLGMKRYIRKLNLRSKPALGSCFQLQKLPDVPIYKRKITLRLYKPESRDATVVLRQKQGRLRSQNKCSWVLLELYKYKEPVIIRYNDIKLKQGCTGPIQIKKSQFTSKESVCGTLELLINSVKLRLLANQGDYFSIKFSCLNMSEPASCPQRPPVLEDGIRVTMTYLPFWWHSHSRTAVLSLKQAKGLKVEFDLMNKSHRYNINAKEDGYGVNGSCTSNIVKNKEDVFTFKGHKYNIVYSQRGSSLTTADAENECHKRYSSLVSILTENELSFIQEILSKEYAIGRVGLLRFFIGLRPGTSSVHQCERKVGPFFYLIIDLYINKDV